MTRMNWEAARDRGRRAELRHAARDLEAGKRSEPRTPRARYTGTCVTCHQRITIGAEIAMIHRNGFKYWRHASCALPSSPGTTAGSS